LGDKSVTHFLSRTHVMCDVAEMSLLMFHLEV
jgi:hypothetical protein